VNAHHEPIEFTLPGEGWVAALDTANGRRPFGAKYPLQDRALALLTRARK